MVKMITRHIIGRHRVHGSVFPDQKNLCDLVNGEHARVHQILGGREFSNRLLVLGFTLGAEVEVIQNYGYGPIIVSVKDSRVALGRGEAKKILVA